LYFAASCCSCPNSLLRASIASFSAGFHGVATALVSYTACAARYLSVWLFHSSLSFSLTPFALLVSASLLVVTTAFCTHVTKAEMLSFNFW
jgi:hypothetical protein